VRKCGMLSTDLWSKSKSSITETLIQSVPMEVVEAQVDSCKVMSR
jgi:hypothetical protein